MVRLAIVEDETSFVNQLKQYCEQFQKEQNIELQITIFRDGDEIIRAYRSQFDLIFMDIQMKFMNGMEAAEEIRKMDSQVELMFITNLAQYAIKGYEVGAMDYILKPLSYFVFSQKLIRALSRIERKKEHYVTIPVKGGLQRIAVSSITYIESEGHNIVFHTRMGVYQSSGTMRDVEEQFAQYQFIRSNKGYLINPEHVEAIRDKCAVVDGQKLLISRARYEVFMKAMTEFWSRGD